MKISRNLQRYFSNKIKAQIKKETRKIWKDDDAEIKEIYNAKPITDIDPYDVRPVKAQHPYDVRPVDKFLLYPK